MTVSMPTFRSRTTYPLHVQTLWSFTDLSMICCLSLMVAMTTTPTCLLSTCMDSSLQITFSHFHKTPSWPPPLIHRPCLTTLDFFSSYMGSTSSGFPHSHSIISRSALVWLDGCFWGNTYSEPIYQNALGFFSLHSIFFAIAALRFGILKVSDLHNISTIHVTVRSSR